ncbi:MAG: amylo-alpha-1,6-glucosidase [Candidatus Diapherotrites archaeon]
MELIDEAAERAEGVIEKCSTPNGLYASGARGGYTSVWARDSMITLLGASLCGDRFKKVYKNSLGTLAKHQSRLGQIPNCVDIFEKKKKVTFATIDSSLWFLIGEHFYSEAYNDKSLLRRHRKNIEKALLWIDYQDAGEDSLPEQQPTCDWQDCFPHKYGHTINTQALYYRALKCFGKGALAGEISGIINGHARKDLTMFDAKQGYYLPWIWKSHDGIREQGNWFDSLGNLLAINMGLAERKKANAILAHIEGKKINRPYPVMCLHPPIRQGTKDWQDYFTKCLAGKEWQYLNAGIWPFIGGFYVSALVTTGQFKKAERELELLAKANRLGIRGKWEFNEWIDPKTGRAKGGAYQAWSAGGYLFAYNAVKNKEVPVFRTKLK